VTLPWTLGRTWTRTARRCRRMFHWVAIRTAT